MVTDENMEGQQLAPGSSRITIKQLAEEIDFSRLMLCYSTVQALAGLDTT